MRSKGSRAGSAYLASVVATIHRSSSPQRGQRGRFDGSRIGSGAAIGRMLRHDGPSGIRSRRGIVKTRLVRIAGKSRKAAQAHLRYIQREGVTRDGESGQLYTKGEDRADGAAFLERCIPDRHQFRFIVAPEDSAEFEDLRDLTRRLMAQMEQDLQTRLDWVAVDHFNTGQPHTHVVLRGKTDREENLVIAREYIAHGMRGRLCELLTLDLGPRSDADIARKLRQDIGQERWTPLDRTILRKLDPDGTIRPEARTPASQSQLTARLQRLTELELAREVVPGRWQVVPDLELKLRALGERGDIVRTLQRAIGAGQHDPAELRVVVPGEGERVIVGRVVATGLAGEHHDRHFVIVDGADGRRHYADLGSSHVEMPVSSLVRIDARPSSGERRVAVELLSHLDLGQLANSDGATWLDRELIAEAPQPLRDAGVGRELRSAQALRRQWLIAQGLAEDLGGTTAYRPDLLAVLERREVLRVAQGLAAKHGLRFAEYDMGERIEGRLVRRWDLVSGSFGEVHRLREFALVPWRPVLERHLGRDVNGIVRADGIRWSMGRERQGPSRG